MREVHILLSILILLSCGPLLGLQQIPTHDPQFNFQLIQPHEVASNYQILKLVDEVLSKHQIPYWAWGGTLIGAIRHQGFIPWDFDSDICLFEEDLERFLDCSEDFKKYDAYILYQGSDCLGRKIAYRLKRIKEEKDIFGHVDISFMRKLDDMVIYVEGYKHFFLVAETKQITSYPFGPISIKSVADYMPYLIRGYGKDVLEMAEIMYTVDPRTEAEYEKFKITQFQPAIYEVIDQSIPLDDTPLFPE